MDYTEEDLALLRLRDEMYKKGRVMLVALHPRPRIADPSKASDPNRDVADLLALAAARDESAPPVKVLTLETPPFHNAHCLHTAVRMLLEAHPGRALKVTAVAPAKTICNVAVLCRRLRVEVATVAPPPNKDGWSALLQAVKPDCTYIFDGASDESRLGAAARRLQAAIAATKPGEHLCARVVWMSGRRATPQSQKSANGDDAAQS